MQRAEGLTALAKSVAHSRISRSHCPCHPARFDGEFCIDATSQIGPRSRSLQCLRHHGCEQPVLPRCDDPNPQRQQGTTRQPATHVIRQTPAAASLRATRLGGRTLVTRTMSSANCGRMPQPRSLPATLKASNKTAWGKGFATAMTAAPGHVGRNRKSERAMLLLNQRDSDFGTRGIHKTNSCQ